jgi:hypothetical protein
MAIATNRRKFLKDATALMGAVTVEGIGAADAATIAKSPSGKPLAGVFPIGWTPCTPDNKINFDAMTAQMKFLNRGKVAGIAWPQNASAWQTISADEWYNGADALTSVKGKSAVVLGVQTVGFDTAKSVEYAKAAKTKGADAIISFVPTGASDEQAIAYFKALSDASSLPIMVQAVGDVSVDTVVALSNAFAPTVRSRISPVAVGTLSSRRWSWASWAPAPMPACLTYYSSASICIRRARSAKPTICSVVSYRSMPSRTPTSM